ncbi:MAG: hypothetical protein QOG51_2008 [Verrucomicrobiota bacterium]
MEGGALRRREGSGSLELTPPTNGVGFGFPQCAFDAGFCGKIRINAMITTTSAIEAV